MRRYEYVKFAVLVITFLLVALSDSTNLRAAKSRKLPEMVCTTKESAFQKRRLTNEIGTSNSINSIMEREQGKHLDVGNDINYGSSFWLRNACHKGFVVVKEQSKVLAQHEGLNEHNDEVELIKESCIDYRAKLSDQVKTRLYSPSARRYICFNQRGKIRTMRRQRAERLGNLCAFYENVVSDPIMTTTGGQPDAALYVTFQSAYNKKWYLGFGPNPLRKRRSRKGSKKGKNSNFHRGVVYTRDGYKATLPRKMVRKQKKNRNLPAHIKTDRCDFRFHTGRYSPQDVEEEWKGLFQHLLQNAESNSASGFNDQKRKITKTANKVYKILSHKNKTKQISKFRTNPNYVASKSEKLSLKSYDEKTSSWKKNVQRTSVHNLEKEVKAQKIDVMNITTTLIETNNSHTNMSNKPPHEKFDSQRSASVANLIVDEMSLSNGVLIPSTSSLVIQYSPKYGDGFSNTSKLLNDDIISNNSHLNPEFNSQKHSDIIPTSFGSNYATVPVSSSHSSKKLLHSSSQNPRNIKISKNIQPVASSRLGNKDGVSIDGMKYKQTAETSAMDPFSSSLKESPMSANNEQSTIPALQTISDEVTANPSFLRRTKESMTRRKKLLERINSLKKQKSVKNNPFRSKKQLKGGPKSIKARLRQRRLRLKYLRQHERPVTSYLYMHNIPRKVKRRLSLPKPLSQQARTKLTVNK